MITHHFGGESGQAGADSGLQLFHAEITDRLRAEPCAKCDDHSHFFTELVYVLQGSCSLEVEGRQVELHPGETLILNPQTAHRSLRGDAGNFSVMTLELCCPRKTGWQPVPCCFVPCGKFPDYDACIRLFCRELQEQPENFEAICFRLAQLMVLYLDRLHSPVRPVSSNRKSALECSRVRRYIDEHFSEPISLDFLAQYAGLNKYYLVHVFNREMGCSPINYLIERRIRESKRLLSTSSLSVRQISARLGFSSPSYFSQSFRRSTGYSPMEFRRRILAANGSESTE